MDLLKLFLYICAEILWICVIQEAPVSHKQQAEKTVGATGAKSGPSFKSGYVAACLHPMSVQDAIDRYDLFPGNAKKGLQSAGSSKKRK